MWIQRQLILSYLTPFVIFILFVPFLLLVVPIPFVSFVPFVPFVLLVPLSHTPPSCPLFPASLSPSPSNVFHLSSSPPLSLLPACQLCHLPFIPFVIFMPSSPLFTLPPSPLCLLLFLILVLTWSYNSLRFWSSFCFILNCNLQYVRVQNHCP